MGKNKTFLWILLAIALVAAMAALPILTGHWQDQATLGTPAIGQIQNVELVFEKGLPGMGLLALMDQGRNWNFIDESAASMTPEEAEQAARRTLEAYQDAGLIDHAAQFELYMRELRAVSLPTGLTGVVWQFVFKIEKKGMTYSEVNLGMDDATGRITNITYSGESQIPDVDMDEMLRKFAEIYFSQLEIEDYSKAETTDLDDTYIGDSSAAKRYRFGDVSYGEIVIDLYVFRYGFYTAFY